MIMTAARGKVAAATTVTASDRHCRPAHRGSTGARPGPAQYRDSEPTRNQAGRLRPRPGQRGAGSTDSD